MKKRIILIGTVIATVTLCWTLGSGTTVDTVPTPAEESVMSAPYALQLHDEMLYVPDFGYLQSEGTSEWSVSEGMHENGNKVGSIE